MDQNTTPLHQPASATLLSNKLLAAILEHVPLQHRLQHCAVVCRAWAGPAAVATTSIECKAPLEAKIPALSAWLDQHGRRLSSLQLMSRSWYSKPPNAGSAPLQLLCAELSQLTKLDLSDIRVNLQMTRSTAPAGGSSDSASGDGRSQIAGGILPSLRELRLANCAFTSSAALLQLPALPGVTRLELEGTPTADRGSGPGQLPDITCSTTAAFQLLRCLPRLAELHLYSFDTAVSCKLMAVVSPSVTCMQLSSDKHDVLASCLPRSLRGPRGVTRLAQLQQLVLSSTAFHPSVLASMPFLVLLELENCHPLPSQVVGAVAQGVTAFLAVVGSLQRLQCLTVWEEGSQPVLAKGWPQDYAGLTAPPQLTKLNLRSCEEPVLPLGAVHHMFPPGRQLPRLQELVLTCGEECGPCMSGADLQGIVSACPALTSLEIRGALQAGDSLSALLQLPPTCRSLAVGGEAFDDTAAAVIPQLTQLTSLEWADAPKLTDAGLDQLTVMQGLQTLQLSWDDGLSAAVSGACNGCMDDIIDLEATPYKAVWQQLQDLLAQSPCNSTWRQRLTQKQQEASALQEQNDRLQQQVSDVASYMQHAMAVLAHCRSDSSAMQLVRTMIDIVRAALSGRTPTAGAAYAATSTLPAPTAASAASPFDQGSQEQQQPVTHACAQYEQLHQQVLAFCSGCPQTHRTRLVIEALEAMHVIALRAVQQQQQQQQPGSGAA